LYQNWILNYKIEGAVCFSMLEMYAPDKFKYPWKLLKWTGVTSALIDHFTSHYEEKFTGEGYARTNGDTSYIR